MSYYPLCSFKTIKENYTDKNKGNYVNQEPDPLHRKKKLLSFSCMFHLLLYLIFCISLDCGFRSADSSKQESGLQPPDHSSVVSCLEHKYFFH